MELIQCYFLNLSCVLESRKKNYCERPNKTKSTRKELLQYMDFSNSLFPSFLEYLLFCCLIMLLQAWAPRRGVFPGALHRSPPKASLTFSVWTLDSKLGIYLCGCLINVLCPLNKSFLLRQGPHSHRSLSYFWGLARCSGAYRGWRKPNICLVTVHQVST